MMINEPVRRYEGMIMNKKFITAFGRKKCGCYICKHTRCAGDVTHLGKLEKLDPIYLCAHCAGVCYDAGFKVYEFYF